MRTARPQKSRRRNRLQSVQRALTILSAFTHDEPKLGITELSRRVHLTKSVVFRAVRTMLEAGFLEQDGAGMYRVGLRAFEVGSLYPLSASLERAAIQPMQDVANRHGHNVYLGVLEGRYVVYLATVDGGTPIRVHVAVGSRAHAHATAMGKVLLASLPPSESRRLLTRRPLEKLTPRTVTDPERIEAQLARIRKLGFAENRGENFVVVSSVAAPVRDRSGNVIAAVSNAFVERQQSRAKWREFTGDLIACAEAISLRLGVATTNGTFRR